MSFRSKLAVAFCSIVLLFITGVCTSWWSMETALRRQQTIFSFTHDINRLFAALSHEEHNYILTGDLTYGHAVRDLLEQIKRRTGPMQRNLTSSQSELVEQVLGDVDRYGTRFDRFLQQMVNVETILSRMITESRRLLNNSKTLTESQNVGAMVILQHISLMLLAEKELIVLDDESAPRRIEVGTSAILNIATTIQQESVVNSEKLRAFRIAKAAAAYRDIFSRYQTEKGELQEMTTAMHESREDLENALGVFVENELTITRNSVARLKIMTMVVSIVGIILSIIITLILSSRITRPLDQLKKSALEIVKGNLDTTVTIDSQDEVGQLGDIFNRMTKKLRDSFADIVQYRDHLEELVEERTKELKKEVADRTNAQEALRANEEQLQTIVDRSPMGIILWDTNFRVSQWNRAAQEIFGYHSHEALGMDAKLLLPPPMRVHMDKIWSKLIVSEGGVRSHNENIHKDGHLIHCDWFNTPIFDRHGSVIGALSMVENVTERLHLEKELLKLEKLESTGILAGGIAHDFNNILTAIIGNINLALLDTKLARNTKSLLKTAEKASMRAKSLTQQLLTFAKGGEPIRESTSLAEIIEDSADFVLHGGNVSVSYRLPDDLWFANVDRGQISQVIQNIVLNSRHAMPNGGQIAITCKNVDPAEDSFSLLDPQRKYVKLSIGDDGIGIPRTIIDKIFDPYFSTKQEGSGLGLAITLSIINKHKGHILVDSDPGIGTEFTIYLPAIEPPDTVEQTIQPVDSPPPPLSILVMDDEEPVQMVLRAMLEVDGHRVDVTADGYETIKRYGESWNSGSPYDLVIIDLTIPGGLGGKETVRELQKINPQVRAIVSSGYSNDPVMASYRQYGFSATVSKPFVRKDLTKAIQAATHSHPPGQA